MVLNTNTAAQLKDEIFDERDREDIHRIIADLRQTYFQRHTEAQSNYHKIQRDSNRALHEVNRIEKHLERIDVFCKKNDIPLDNYNQQEN